MAENLAFLPSVSPSWSRSETFPFNYVYDYQGESIKEAKAALNYDTYGALYNWESAKNACPPGWHLPSDSEWTTLTAFLGGETVAGGKMKETGITHWESPNSGATNTSGFTALPGGYQQNNSGFTAMGYFTTFWSSTVIGSNAWYRDLAYYNDGVTRNFSDHSPGYSVRCIRD
jgi:uncharacterized protein (TIGR02145 family)